MSNVITSITNKIVDYEVVKNDQTLPMVHEPTSESLHESVKRPLTLEGTTYKIKTPTTEHAMYVTINDIVLNPGTPNEVRRPFEIFINSRNMDHFQWTVALTRIISAVFRKGGECAFLVDELRSVFDPKGGYLKRGGKWMPSLIAEIGDVLEQHLTKIGVIAQEQDPDMEALLASKLAQVSDSSENPYPPGATICPKCQTKALVKLDGCSTCLNCGDSKCG